MSGENNQNNPYWIHFNRLCEEKFGLSASQVVCEEMGKSKNQLTRIYQGEFPTQDGLRQDFEKHFQMPYYSIESYIKYGPHGESCPLGYSASILREERIKHQAPNYEILFGFLKIDQAEWDEAIAGNNEFCYDRADELEEYFGFTHGYLRGIGHAFEQYTYVFSPYPYEQEVLKQAENNKTADDVFQKHKQDKEWRNALENRLRYALSVDAISVIINDGDKFRVIQTSAKNPTSEVLQAIQMIEALDVERKVYPRELRSSK